MADELCVPILLEVVRAYIQIGPNYYVTTGTDPNSAGDILSFSINKARGQPMSTFRCNLSVRLASGALERMGEIHDQLGHRIIVHAGVGNKSDTSLPRLFQGYVINMTSEPHWNDSRYFLLNISGEDEFTKLKRKKYSRRFKSTEDAYAVITGGKHREGGRMTKLRRVPAGKKGVTHHDTGSSTPGGALGHSPLIRTPDPAGLSPDGAKPGSKPAREFIQGNVQFEQPDVYMGAGDKFFATIIDKKTGKYVDPTELEYTVGTKCMVNCKPPTQAFKGGIRTAGNGMTPGEDAFPLKVEFYGSRKPYPADPKAVGMLFTSTGDVPKQVTFVHPLTAANCTINFHQIPPHDHTSIPQGGPAQASYGAFQV